MGANRAMEKSGRDAMVRARQFPRQARASSCPAVPTAASRSQSADRGGRALARARRTYGHASSQRSMRQTRLTSITVTVPEDEGKSCARRAIKGRGARSARRSIWRASAPTTNPLDTTGWTSDARCVRDHLGAKLNQRLIPLGCVAAVPVQCVRTVVDGGRGGPDAGCGARARGQVRIASHIRHLLQ